MLTVLRLPLAVAKASLDHDLIPLGKKFAKLLATRAEHGAIEEVGELFPLTRLGVAAAVVHGNAKRHDGLAARGRANLGITREIAGNGDVVDRHFGFLSPVRLTFL